MTESHDENLEELFNELLDISNTVDVEEEIARIAEQSLIELKNDSMMPIFDEYYRGNLVEEMSNYKSAKKKLKDPKGGLTAAGRAYFKRKEGANLKPGVKGPANTPEKMRRKGSFLTRFFTNPSGPMVDDKGRATRLALSAAAWGEPVPKNAEDAAKLAAKGRRLLERYRNLKKKSEEPDYFSKLMFSSDAEKLAITSEISSDGINIKSLYELSSIEDSVPTSEVSDREILKKSMMIISPSFVNGNKILLGNEKTMERMRKAAEEMQKERQKKK